MSTTIILIVAVIAVIALLAARGGGPRITEITRRHESEDRKDGDNA
ncbi:MAG: hypothetical protein HOP96_02515 [Sphingomonas sp.]|nr:hypothetical protein [Sphingomonas sp.]